MLRLHNCVLLNIFTSLYSNNLALLTNLGDTLAQHSINDKTRRLHEYDKVTFSSWCLLVSSQNAYTVTSSFSRTLKHIIHIGKTYT